MDIRATNNFRYKLIRDKENVYAVDWLPHWYSIFAGVFICFFEKKAYTLTEQQAAFLERRGGEGFSFSFLGTNFDNTFLYRGKSDISADEYRRKSEWPLLYFYFAICRLFIL